MSEATNAQTFLKLVEQNKQAILRICSVYGQTVEDREDLFQEIVFNIWRSLPSFRAESKIETWLYRIALNVAQSFSRQTTRRFARRTPLAGLEFKHPSDEDVSTNIEGEEEIARLQRCIALLEKVEKSIITLHLEELSHKEIAEVVGITSNHVAVKINRIKAKLLNCLNGTA